jgi:DNA-binding IclR family transcriptional regulator
VSRVQSIERAFAVLAALAEGPLGVTEVADRVRLPKSTVARLLSALQAEGAVEQVSTDARYRLGPQIVALAANVLPMRSLTVVAHPDLVGLAAAVGEAAGLSVPDGWSVHYVDQVSVAHEVQVRDWTGTRAPMHAVSSGQVFLAHLPPGTLDRFLQRTHERFTPHTLTVDAALRDRLRRVQLDGYAWVREEFAVGINSVAAGIAGPGGELAAAVHVHGPSYRFPKRGAEDEIARLVVASAARISVRLRQSSGVVPG